MRSLHFAFSASRVILKTSICLLASLMISSLAQAEVLFDIDFGAKSGRVDTISTNTSGTLPEGAREDSGWAKVKANYERMEDAMGGGLSWTRVTISDHQSGRIQIKMPVGKVSEKSYFRFSYILASPTGSTARLIMRDDGSPYKAHWDQSINLNADRRSGYFDFALNPIDSPIAAFIELGTHGVHDVYRLTLERKTEQELVQEAERKYPNGGPVNLLRHTHFPLGLPFDWSERDRASREWDWDVEALWDEGLATGMVPLSVKTHTNKPFNIATAPFIIPLPHLPHQASIYVKGTVDEGTLHVISDGKEIAKTQITCSEGDGWKRISVPFQPEMMSRWNIMQIQAKGNFLIGGAMVSPGNSLPANYSRAFPAELQLSAKHQTGDTFVEGIDSEPVITYAVAGSLGKNATLKLTLVNHDGDRIELPDHPLKDVVLQKGTLKPEFPFAEKRYGAYRLEGKVVSNGNSISNESEVVYFWLRQPNYYNQAHRDSPFGLHFDTYDPHVNAARAMGVKWTRFHGPAGPITYWSGVQREPGEFKFNDREVKYMTDRGFSILGVWTETPYWARSARARKGAAGWLDNWWQPADYNQFADYVREISRHYKGVIDHWQVWNEPWGHFWFKDWRPELSGQDRWHPGETPIEDYAELEQVAYQAGKEGNPDAVVVGMHGTLGPKGTGWVEKILSLTEGKSFDVASYHAYRIGRSDDMLEAEKSTQIRDLNNQILQPMKASGIPNLDKKPIWMTEGKASNAQPDMGMMRVSLNLDEDQVKDAEQNGIDLVNYHLMKFSHGIDKIFIYTIGDKLYRGPQSGIYWGVLSMPGGKLTVSAPIYSAMTWHLEDTRFLNHEEVAKGVHRFDFEKTKSRGDWQQGDVIQVYASQADAEPYSIGKDATHRLHDPYGNPMSGTSLEPVRIAYKVIPSSTTPSTETKAPVAKPVTDEPQKISEPTEVTGETQDVVEDSKLIWIVVGGSALIIAFFIFLAARPKKRR